MTSWWGKCVYVCVGGSNLFFFVVAFLTAWLIYVCLFQMQNWIFYLFRYCFVPSVTHHCAGLNCGKLVMVILKMAVLLGWKNLYPRAFHFTVLWRAELGVCCLPKCLDPWGRCLAFWLRCHIPLWSCWVWVSALAPPLSFLTAHTWQAVFKAQVVGFLPALRQTPAAWSQLHAAAWPSSSSLDLCGMNKWMKGFFFFFFVSQIKETIQQWNFCF